MPLDRTACCVNRPFNFENKAVLVWCVGNAGVKIQK